MSTTPIMQKTSSIPGPRWSIMFDGNNEGKIWVNISSPSHQAVKLLNGTPLNPGSELRGREIRRTPPRLSTSRTTCASSQRNTCDRRSRLPCKASLTRPKTGVPFERTAKFYATPLSNQTTPRVLKCEQRKLVFGEDGPNS